MKTATKHLTSRQAYEIASQWGSMMNSYDPGYVFYTFPAGAAVVIDEDHRMNLIAYTKDCIKIARSKKDKNELAALLQYFTDYALTPELDEFTTAYIEAALWSTNDESTESGGDPMDENYSVSDIAPETLSKIIADCAKFQSDQATLLVDENCVYRSPNDTAHSTLAQAGHDFWLTRCGHGCGFWDGDWSEPAASVLTTASQRFGNVDLYVGDDGKIYQ
jgi:hypothetical protein